MNFDSSEQGVQKNPEECLARDFSEIMTDGYLLISLRSKFQLAFSLLVHPVFAAAERKHKKNANTNMTLGKKGPCTRIVFSIRPNRLLEHRR